ncbi:MAG TPA: DUF4124 domain-containing protein [Burkholderiaceae bacterium]|nr:DUF4124 domain-containing protein [Burkholderiaceae bacterium]
MTRTVLFIATCVLSATAPATYAQLYKWVDDSGVVNYGDWPPAGVKVQPVTGGTLSSVADRALVGSPARAPDAARSAPRSAGPAANARNYVLPPNAAASPGDANVVGGYEPYYGYAWRPAVAAEAERRLTNAPVARPLLPIDPAIPEMPLRPRR